jgi:hypothetical protein
VRLFAPLPPLVGVSGSSLTGSGLTGTGKGFQCESPPHNCSGPDDDPGKHTGAMRVTTGATGPVDVVVTCPVCGMMTCMVPSSTISRSSVS